MEQAVQELSSCKRYLESMFSDSRPRIDDCTRYYEKFTALYASKADAAPPKASGRRYASTHLWSVVLGVAAPVRGVLW